MKYINTGPRDSAETGDGHTAQHGKWGETSLQKERSRAPSQPRHILHGFCGSGQRGGGGSERIKGNAMFCDRRQLSSWKTFRILTPAVFVQHALVSQKCFHSRIS